MKCICDLLYAINIQRHTCINEHIHIENICIFIYIHTVDSLDSSALAVASSCATVSARNLAAPASRANSALKKRKKQKKGAPINNKIYFEDLPGRKTRRYRRRPGLLPRCLFWSPGASAVLSPCAQLLWCELNVIKNSPKKPSSCACVCRCRGCFLCRCVLCACDLLMVLRSHTRSNEKPHPSKATEGSTRCVTK